MRYNCRRKPTAVILGILWGNYGSSSLFIIILPIKIHDFRQKITFVVGFRTLFGQENASGKVSPKLGEKFGEKFEN